MGIYCCGGMDSSFVPDVVQTIEGRFSHHPAEESEEYVRVCFAMVCI